MRVLLTDSVKFKHEIFRSERIRLGISQREAAEGAGVSPTTVEKIEKGICPNPTFRIVMALCRFYGISPMDLLDFPT